MRHSVVDEAASVSSFSYTILALVKMFEQYNLDLYA
jgi:hypothetical protein